ncbi:MAG: substrate-binding domain-containing protein [Clostridia bacterium]|nr:substrate-binding domain-containing protein [Clostridia bacterium]
MQKNDVYVLVQPSEKEFFWINNILVGMQKMAVRQEYNLCLFNKLDCSEIITGVPVLIVGYTYRWVRDSAEEAVKRGLRPIIVGACLHPDLKERCNGVDFELTQIIRQVMHYLEQVGCKRTALLGVNRSSIADREKEKTILLMHKEDCDVYVCEQSLARCVDEFIESFKIKPYNGVLCVNDTVAIYLINRLKIEGIRVPEDVMVVGIGNSNLGQRHFVPITSINFDYCEMGRQAIRAWSFIRKSNSASRLILSLPCELIIRGSTGNLNPENSSDTSDYDFGDGNESYYYDPDVQSIIHTEAFLGECDDIDREILYCLTENLTYSEMADKLNLTDRAIKYRVAKMIKNFGAEKREDISAIMKALLNPNEK